MGSNYPTVLRLSDLITYHFIKDSRYVHMTQSNPENKDTTFSSVGLFYSWRSDFRAKTLHFFWGGGEVMKLTDTTFLSYRSYVEFSIIKL